MMLKRPVIQVKVVVDRVKKNILFLCTGNSCRSQMAEGLGRHLKGSEYNFFSAGIEKHGLNPYALEVMQEIGVDISGQESNTIDELPVKSIDFVITVCSDANRKCPYFPGRRVIHQPFDDPPSLSSQMRDKEEIRSVYRRVRDEIRVMILNLETILK